MRMLVGLSSPDGGQALLFGGRYRDLPNPGRRVGILLDASAQHAGRRGREALAVAARTMGVPVQRIDTVLKLVGLDETAAGRRVGRYSLGDAPAPRPRPRVARRPLERLFFKLTTAGAHAPPPNPRELAGATA